MANILIAEDEVIISMDLEQSLTAMGHTVVGRFPSGEDILDHFAQLKPDVVFMDVNLLGNINGIEAARIMQSQGCPAAMVFCSAYTDLTTLQSMDNLPFAGFLSKPFSDYDIASVLKGITEHATYATRINNDSIGVIHYELPPVVSSDNRPYTPPQHSQCSKCAASPLLSGEAASCEDAPQ
jgi:DNA-binding NarL/FixJ family response regulator